MTETVECGFCDRTGSGQEVEDRWKFRIDVYRQDPRSAMRDLGEGEELYGCWVCPICTLLLEQTEGREN